MSLAPPEVSVIVPAYNSGRFITATIESGLAQSFEALEVIVIDDGSSDDTLARLAQFHDPRLRVIEQAHQGAPAALNAGVCAARGGYIGFLDHDDLWASSKVARHLETFRRDPRLAATFSWYGLIDEDGRRINLRTPRWRGPVSFRQLLEDYVIGSTSTLMVRRSAIVDAGGFDAQFPRCHDLDLMLRISLREASPVCAVPEELTLYRRHSGQMSGDWRAMQREWNMLLDKMRGLAPEETAAVEALARGNMNRYYACLAYENGRFSEASALIRDSFRSDPRAFVADWRSWRVAAACCSAALLPGALHFWLERLAGVRRERGPSRGPLL